jgi:hypothetical protein
VVERERPAPTFDSGSCTNVLPGAAVLLPVRREEMLLPSNRTLPLPAPETKLPLLALCTSVRGATFRSKALDVRPETVDPAPPPEVLLWWCACDETEGARRKSEVTAVVTLEAFEWVERIEREDFETVKFESPFGRVGLIGSEGSAGFEAAAASWDGLRCVSQPKAI